MITFFTIPKAWQGEAALSQRNAVTSWLALGAHAVLFGDDQGVAAAAAELGAQHVPTITRNAHGTPLIDGVFADAHTLAGPGLLCFANTDIVLGPDFTPAAELLESSFDRFLMVGESWDTAVRGPIDLAEGWQERIAPGRKRGAGALDWFLFTRGIFETIPPFAVGRAAFDNWLVWRARNVGASVVDATRAVHVVHQAHGYAHVAAGFEGTRAGAEAAANWELVGSKRRVYTRFDATHVLAGGRLRRNIAGTLRAKERARKVVWKLRHRQLLPARIPR